nr:MMPL family transporter [Streptomyces virginiae]
MAPSVKKHVPLVSLIVICGWILLAFISAPLVSGPDSMAGTQRSSLLPRGAESTAVAAVLEAAPASAGSVPLVVVWTATREPQGLRARAARSLSSPEVRALTGGAPIPVLVSRDGSAAAGVLPIRTGPGKPSPTRAAAGVRAAAARAPWTTVALAGPAAVQADLDGVFDGVDSRLLVVALVAVLLILLVVYRSPLLPLLVIATSLLALAVSCALLYGPARAAGLIVDGQVQGILFVLIIGATTDYGLLLTARYREELGRGQTGEASLRLAWRRSLTPLSAGAATVTAGLLALMLSDLPVHRSLGAAGAIAMGSSLLCALTFLPAALGLLGPAAFWPRRKHAAPVDGAWLWQRIASAAVRRPRRIWAYVLGALVLGAALSPVLSMQGIPLDRALASTAPSVSGQAALERSFPGGLGNPALVLTDPAHVDAVTSVVARTGGVARADIVAGPGGRPETVGGRAQIAVTLTPVADSQAAMTTIRNLRTAVDAISGAAVQVGGQAAEAYDMRAACAHDRLVIMPVALALIALILVLLLRCLLLPLLLVLSVVLSFLSALGACAVVATSSRDPPTQSRRSCSTPSSSSSRWAWTTTSSSCTASAKRPCSTAPGRRQAGTRLDRRRDQLGRHRPGNDLRRAHGDATRLPRPHRRDRRDRRRSGHPCRPALPGTRSRHGPGADRLVARDVALRRRGRPAPPDRPPQPRPGHITTASARKVSQATVVHLPRDPSPSSARHLVIGPRSRSRRSRDKPMTGPQGRPRGASTRTRWFGVVEQSRSRAAANSH